MYFNLNDILLAEHNAIVELIDNAPDGEEYAAIDKLRGIVAFVNGLMAKKEES